MTEREHALRAAYQRGRDEFRNDVINPYEGFDDALAERYREGRQAELDAIYK